MYNNLGDSDIWQHTYELFLIKLLFILIDEIILTPNMTLQ